MENRLYHISFLQFIGPIFVILGHSSNSMPTSDAYYTFTKEWIYIFHMPLFFFISGYIFSYKNGLKDKSYKSFIKGKFQRLLIPYLLWNLIFILPKFLFSDFIVDNPELNINYFLELFITPRAMILGHTWFLAALFIVFVISPVFNFLINSKNKKMIWISITLTLVFLYLYPIPTDVLALSDLSKNVLFFWIGIMIGRVPLSHLKKTLTQPLLFTFILIITLIFTFISLFITQTSAIKMIACFLTIMILLAIPLLLNIKNIFIEKIGQLSFGIYILHWPVMLSVQIIFYRILDINSDLVIIMMAFAGFVIPYIALRFVQSLKFDSLVKSKRYLFGM